jgi:hypothetical protein
MSRVLAAALFAVVALAVVRTVQSAEPPTPAQLAVYARGWIDGAAPPGVYVTSATCSHRRVCTVILNDGSCARATIHGYAFPGPWKRCRRKGPKS